MVVILLKGPKMPFFGNLQKHVLKVYLNTIYIPYEPIFDKVAVPEFMQLVL